MGDCDTSRCEHGRGLDAGCDVCTPSHAALVARVAELEAALRIISERGFALGGYDDMTGADRMVDIARKALGRTGA